MTGAGEDEMRSALLLTEDEWMHLRSIVNEWLSDGPGTDEQIALVTRIIEATDD